jgi:AcrR family transcriptional regulator
MSQKRNSYHHGDLRNALIIQGIRCLEQNGVKSLSLRKIAKAVGVTHNAPYQHFANKEALLAAIATEGFNQLIAALDVAVANVPPNASRERLLAICIAYVTFAENRPALFQIMFGPVKHSDHQTLFQASQNALKRLINVVRESQQNGWLGGNTPLETALTIWFSVHGIANILITGKIPSPLKNQKASTLTRRTIEQLLDGLAAS